MEVNLLWKETKTFYGLLIIPNIITEKWDYSQYFLSWPFEMNKTFYLNMACKAFVLSAKLINISTVCAPL